MTYKIHAADLNDFIRHVDDIGGLGTPEFQSIQQSFQLEFSTQIDSEADPYSETYVESQLSLYREISGKSFYDTQSEMTSFDIENMVLSTSPYGIRSPNLLAHHYLRIGEVVYRADLPDAPLALDLGAGWGLSSEFLATLGAEVVAIDVNPLFVELVNRRANRFRFPISASVGTFENLGVRGRYDLIMFYECLHHAVRPWQVLASCGNLLALGGKLGLSGEPIQDIWWPHWGMRLDATSVYCIRKFGWFESGWSRSFLADMMHRAGMHLELFDAPLPIVGTIGIAKMDLRRFSSGWLNDNNFAIATGRSQVDLTNLCSDQNIGIRVVNYRHEPIWYKLLDKEGVVVSESNLNPGHSILPLNPSLIGSYAVIESEIWNPAIEIGNGDTRDLSFHAEGLAVNY